MSTGSQSSATHVALGAALATTVSLASRQLARALRAAAFWTAAVLPLAYVPFVAGLVPADAAASVLGLVVLHACCLALGHGYAPRDGD